MDLKMGLVFAKKLNEICGLESDNLIYTLTASIDNKPDYMRGIYSHTLDKLPLIVDSSLEIFGSMKTDVAKNSYVYLRLEEEKENFIKILTNSRQLLKLKEIKIGSNKNNAAFAALSHIYFSSFITPIQFFLPHSSICSGQWDFWDGVNYLELMKRLNEKTTIFEIREKILKSNVWKTRFKVGDFPEIVKRRLVKEGLLDKNLGPNALMKAIIIRMGELAAPSINYEAIDFSIRSFFTYLGIKQYLRVDREILFLRRLEEEMKRILAEV